MAQGTSYAAILLLSLCIAVCTVGQELEIEGSNSAPDVFDLESEFEGIDNVYGEPYDETEENEEPDEQEEVIEAEPEEVVEDDEPEEVEQPDEPEEVVGADEQEEEVVEADEQEPEVVEADEPEVVEEADEPAEAEEVDVQEEFVQADEPEVAEEADEPEGDDDEVSVRVTEEGFPACSTFDETAQALFLPEHVLWSVGLEDATSCCEICEAYLECRMWTMDRTDLLCTLLVTDEVETSQNVEWATGYKEL